MAADQREPNSIVLAAGGTGGHLFPAQALAEELKRRGYGVHLITDSRGRDFGGEFPATRVFDVPSATLSLGQPWSLPINLLQLWRGYNISKTILLQLRPQVVVGFGGYPSVPPLAAATRLRLPTIVHEQNAIMGRANRAMAKRASAIASSFPSIFNLSPSLKKKLELTGNPVRSQVLKFARSPYDQPAADRTFKLLVFGGSQGAKFLSQTVPLAIADLAGPIRRKLKITQQCREEDVGPVKARYEEMGIDHEVQAFFSDLPRRIAGAHLVICRSGASTIAELAVIGRPAILVPLPHAVDNDQLRNAESFASAGAGWLLRQESLSAESLAALITSLRYHESGLAEAASAALEIGRPNAAELLADVVERFATAPVKELVTDNVGLHHEVTP
jgi:UDP-N-acetylglucosamine--N-acetylmuramyl-(pentapeptide) pyrophosphoryl-undecaprenol N-acetylglucosamine transferase